MELKIPEQFRHATPDSARMARIRESIAGSAAPVRRLPSNAILIASSVAVFLVLVVLFAAPAGLLGFARMSVATRLIEYGVILVLAVALAATVVAQMVPGSRHLWSPELCICLALFTLCVSCGLSVSGFRHGQLRGPRDSLPPLWDSVRHPGRRSYMGNDAQWLYGRPRSCRYRCRWILRACRIRRARIALPHFQRRSHSGVARWGRSHGVHSWRDDRVDVVPLTSVK